MSEENTSKVTVIEEKLRNHFASKNFDILFPLFLSIWKSETLFLRVI